jgi:hypothetical protein
VSLMSSIAEQRRFIAKLPQVNRATLLGVERGLLELQSNGYLYPNEAELLDKVRAEIQRRAAK